MSNNTEKISIVMHPKAFAAFGADLVTNDVVALIELVKNSFVMGDLNGDNRVSGIDVRFALKNAEFVRYGVMHRNTFIDSPRHLGSDFGFKAKEGLYFAGQITGVEGYMESAASGILAGINAANKILGKEEFLPSELTMTGALARYISDPSVKNFQPMGANFGILPPIEPKIRDKRERYAALADRGLNDLETN